MSPVWTAQLRHGDGVVMIGPGATILAEPADHFGDERIYIAADCGGQQWIFAEPKAPA